MKDFSDGLNCPVCGAKAYWNDEECIWVCESCGYEIQGDQIAFDNDGNGSVLDIDWYCDECDEHLNNQIGFDPYSDTWTCTECGHVNNLDKDSIV